VTVKVDLMAAMRDLAEAADHLDLVYDDMCGEGGKVDIAGLLAEAATVAARAVDLIRRVADGLEKDSDSPDGD
jgi:hypothetical protein